MKLPWKRNKYQADDIFMDEEIKKIRQESELDEQRYNRLMKAVKLEQQGELEGAIIIYEELVKFRHNAPAPYENLAKILAMQEQYHKAKEVLLIMVEVFSESKAVNAPVIVERGQKYVAQLNNQADSNK